MSLKPVNLLLQAETKLQKRSKAVKFSREGLRAPHDQGSGSEDEDDEAPSTSGTVVNSIQMRHRQDPGESKGQKVTVQVPVLPVTYVPCSVRSTPDTQNSSPSLHTPAVRDSTRAMVLI